MSPAVWIGDSHSTVAEGDVPGKYNAVAGKRVMNNAVSGEAWTLLSHRIPDQYQTSLGVREIFAQGGTNDLRLGASAVSTAATVFAFVDARLAEGKKVILSNVPPCRGYVGCTTPVLDAIDDYNAIFVTECAARPSLICVDLYSLIDDGTGAIDARCNSVDFIHMGNGPCQQEWADAIKAVAP